MFVLVTGNPQDGFNYYGPLQSGDDIDAEDRALRNEYWWICDLHDPTEFMGEHLDPEKNPLIQDLTTRLPEYGVESISNLTDDDLQALALVVAHVNREREGGPAR